MQQLDLSKFPNSSGWRVEHDRDSQMYYIRSEHGHRKEGVFTTRKFAEMELLKYLEDIAKKQWNRDKKKAK